MCSNRAATEPERSRTEPKDQGVRSIRNPRRWQGFSYKAGLIRNGLTSLIRKRSLVRVQAGPHRKNAVLQVRDEEQVRTPEGAWGHLAGSRRATSNMFYAVSSRYTGAALRRLRSSHPISCKATREGSGVQDRLLGKRSKGADGPDPVSPSFGEVARFWQAGCRKGSGQIRPLPRKVFEFWGYLIASGPSCSSKDLARDLASADLAPTKISLSLA